MTAPKVVLGHPSVRKAQPQQPSTSVNPTDVEEYEESVQTLVELFSGKNLPGAKIVQDLLDTTRQNRNKWLLEEISNN